MSKHSDCAHFIPVDCAKGLCAYTNNLINTDSNVCPKFKALPKCKLCASYTAEKDNMGTCTGLPDKSFWAYDEMIAKQCPGFQPRS